MYLIIIITFLLLSFIVSSISDYLNTKNIKDTLPNEFIGYYDEEKYKKSQNYLKDRTKFSFISALTSLIISIVFILYSIVNYIINDRINIFYFANIFSSIICFYF